MSTTAASPAPAQSVPPLSAATHLRGSSLLTAGRFLSVGINFVVQVLIARYLSQTAFGAFAYALSLVTLAETIATFGLDRGVGRFLALYDERRDYPRVLGTLVFVLGTIGSLGIAIVLLVIGLQSWLVGTVIDDRQAVALLVILIVLAPLQAVDNVLSGVLAVFGSARSIFFRKYVLAPGLRLTVVLLLVLGGFDVGFLAVGYVVAGAVGVLLYSGILWRVLGRSGIRGDLRLRRGSIPARELLAFTLPLLSTDLVYVCIMTVDVLLLGALYGPEEVAELRVVQPLVNLNLVVYSSFTMLYMPIASRLFARGDRQGVRDLYWKTAIWVAVFSFPMFALTATAAEPVTRAIFGERYAESAVILAVLAVGHYFNAAFGFNGLTLRVFGFLRYTLLTNLGAVAVNITLNLLLVPRFGALGAAVATAGTLVVHNLVKQLGLRRGTGIDVFDWRYARVYAVVLLAAGVLVLVDTVVEPGVVVSVALVILTSLAVLMLNRRALDVAGTFPALRRLPLLGRLLAA